MQVTPDPDRPGVYLLGSSGPTPEPDLTWHPGEGVPMVVVRDPSQTMQLALPGNHRSDYAVTIEEVG